MTSKEKSPGTGRRRLLPEPCARGSEDAWGHAESLEVGSRESWGSLKLLVKVTGGREKALRHLIFFPATGQDQVLG